MSTLLKIINVKNWKIFLMIIQTTQHLQNVIPIYHSEQRGIEKNTSPLDLSSSWWFRFTGSIATSLFVKYSKTRNDSSLSGFGTTNQSGVCIARMGHRASKRRSDCFSNTLFMAKPSGNVDREELVRNGHGRELSRDLRQRESLPALKGA